MPWFTWLEKRTGVQYTMVHSPLDSYIPFIEYFVIPYLLWFVFIATTGLYFFFTEKQSFYRMAAFTITGMTLFLIICTFFPNGQELRPHTFEHDNIFVSLVQVIYATDTPTNVLPSLHVFNSLGASVAIAHSPRLRKHPGPLRRLLSGGTDHSVYRIFKTTFCNGRICRICHGASDLSSGLRTTG